MCILFSKNPWKIFHSFHLFFFSFGLYKSAFDLEKRRKESCIYLFGQLFFKRLSSKIPRKFQEKCILQRSADVNSIFSSVFTMGPLSGATELNKQYRN